MDPRARIAALGLLDRAFGATTDDELTAVMGALGDDHRRELARLAGTTPDDPTPGALRDAVQRGRLNGVAEAVVAVLTDRVLADCIEQLGDRADLPSADDLREVAPGLIERHGLGPTRLMFAAAVCGDAPARPTLVELLRHDEVLGLPAVERAPAAARPQPTPEELAERERIRAARAARREKEREQAAARRQQAAATRTRRR